MPASHHDPLDQDPLERDPFDATPRADPLDADPLGGEPDFAAVAVASSANERPREEDATLPSVGAPRAVEPEAPPPAIIRGRYRVERALGAGGMGEVLLAEDVDLRRRVAIKRVRADLSRDVELRRRIERECLLHAKVGAHAHIVTLYDRFEEDGRIHLVMEYVEGESLQSLLDRGRREGRLVPLVEALTIVSQTLDALARIHAAGLVHRDIKPDNIMVARDDAGAHHAKLMDFGIARVQDPGQGGTRLTQVGMSGPGTPRYMAPEQIDPSSFGELSAATDLYAIGIMLYELVSGDAPFTGGVATVFMGHLMNEAPPLNLQPPSTLHVRLEEAIRRAISKAPADRFASARAFREEIDRLIAAGETRPHEGRGPTPLAVSPPRGPEPTSSGARVPVQTPPAARASVPRERGRGTGARRAAGILAASVVLVVVAAGAKMLRPGKRSGDAGVGGPSVETGPMGRFEGPVPTAGALGVMIGTRDPSNESGAPEPEPPGSTPAATGGALAAGDLAGTSASDGEASETPPPTIGSSIRIVSRGDSPPPGGVAGSGSISDWKSNSSLEDAPDVEEAFDAAPLESASDVDAADAADGNGPEPEADSSAGDDTQADVTEPGTEWDASEAAEIDDSLAGAEATIPTATPARTPAPATRTATPRNPLSVLEEFGARITDAISGPRPESRSGRSGGPPGHDRKNRSKNRD